MSHYVVGFYLICCETNTVRSFCLYGLNYIFLLQVEGKSLATPVLLLFFDGLFSMLQNVFAFTVLAMVSTLSYAVANATKRVVIIGASLFVLQNPITISNFIGMMIAIFGVLVYNKVSMEKNMYLFTVFMSHLWALCFLVCASVHSFIPLQVKFLVKVVFDEVEVQST